MQNIKNRAVCICTIIILSLLFAINPYFSVAAKSESVNVDIKDGFTKVCTKNSLSLFLNRENYEFCIEDSSSGTVWYSNPQDKENEKIAVGVNKMNIFSSLIVSYRDIDRKVVETVNTYTGSVYDNNVKVEEKKNGFIIYYKFNSIRAVVPLEVILYDECVKCTINSNKIVESDKFPILSISLLPYFGAGGLTDNGYLMVPDGSGAIINFNNGKASFGSYSQKVYGQDEIIQTNSKALYNQSIRLPVFGIKSNDNGLLGVIEKGDALATINAASSGKISGYNAVNASFNLRITSIYSIGEKTGGSTTDVTLVEDNNIKRGNLTVAYYPLEKGKSDYSGMAEKYKNCLKKELGLKEKTDKQTMILETIGTVNVKRYFLGIPYMKKVVFTDFNAINNITSELNNKGVDKINVIYSGWTNDELNKTPIDSAKVISKIGGKSGLKKLLKSFEKTSNRIYLSTDYYKVQKFTGFETRNNSSIMSISGKPVVCYQYNFLNYFKEYNSPVSFIISMKKIDKYVDKFTKSFLKLPDDVNISVGDISDKLPSDFTEKGWSRQDSENTYKNVIEKLARGRKISVLGANKYALGKTDCIINTPSKSSEFDYTDESIPFYQLVVSGLTDYSFKPLNLSSEMKIDFLKSVETGADLHFFVVDKNTDVLDDAGYSSLYSVKSSDWIETIVEYSKEIKEISNITGGTPFVKHCKISENVYKSTFLNGSFVIVNYNDKPITADGYTIDAMDYVVIE